MGRKKKSNHYNGRTYRLMVVYTDGGNRQTLDSHSEEYMAGEPVYIPEKVFAGNGGIWVSPIIRMTMPRHDVYKQVECRKPSKSKNHRSRHDR